ncbi:hypothetical protein BX616_007769 [Lobosporangium transversale]|nr:hypothetical protein BX616_007769 [Lobosporangium transversale]
MAQSYYRKTSVQQTEQFLEAPPLASTDIRHRTEIQRARTSVFEAVKAFAQLDVKRKVTPADRVPPALAQARGLTTVFGKDVPMALFTVKKARKYIECNALKAWIAKPVSRSIYLRPPIYKHIRFMDRKPWPNIQHTPIPDKQWDRFFSDRLHSKHRYTNERHHLYLVAHHVYQTNGIKSKYKYNTPVSPDCRRCGTDGAPAAFESRGHAFHDCPEVLELWNACRGWIKELVPELDLRDNAAQDQLCWPEVKSLPAVVIHIHATVTQVIFKTYCKLGDKETVPEGVLKAKAIAALRYRIKLEWERAHYKDQVERERQKSGEVADDDSEDEDNDDNNVQKFLQEWNYPPHIRVEGEELIFGGIMNIATVAAAMNRPAIEGAEMEDEVMEEEREVGQEEVANREFTPSLF